MKVICIGDVVGSVGCKFLRQKLPELKRKSNADLVICNGENASDGNGITPTTAELLFNSGVDVITLGNHSFRRAEIYEFLNENEFIARPANYPKKTTPGRGFCTLDFLKFNITVVNLMGNFSMQDSLKCPFEAIDEILEQVNSNIIILDFHAETTSEKLAMGYYLDGKVSAVFGTHTHVQTSDNAVLKGGTGYITDIGMTGPRESVLGVKPEIIIEKFRTKLPARFEIATEPCKMEGIIFDIDEKNGKTTNTERFRIF